MSYKKDGGIKWCDQCGVQPCVINQQGYRDGEMLYAVIKDAASDQPKVKYVCQWCFAKKKRTSDR